MRTKPKIDYRLGITGAAMLALGFFSHPGIQREEVVVMGFLGGIFLAGFSESVFAYLNWRESLVIGDQ